MPSFNDFPLQNTTHAVLTNMQITEPTSIQAEAIPVLLSGRDLVGQSATGSGKTLAYSIPLVERLARERVVQALVLVPTRELALQVNSVLSKLASSRKLTTALLVGGRPYGTQNSALRYGSQIVVGTPGRVKDHLERGTLVLNQLRICILDEADQMLDSGFAPVIEDILTTTPETRQMALFSATMPDWVEKLKEKFLKDPVTVDITPAAGAPSTIEQIAYQVPQAQKIAALCTLLNSTLGESSLVFGKTKFGVEKLGKHLTKLGFTVGTLHGNKSQRAREEVLTAFRRGQVQTLLATNVAARGLDIQGIYQVINYELPESSELFTHRVGRTGRMGQQGKAITLLAPADVPKWRRMARNLGQNVALQRLAIDEEAIAGLLQNAPTEAELETETSFAQEEVQTPRNALRTAHKPSRPAREQTEWIEHESELAFESARPRGERERPAGKGRTPFDAQRRSRPATRNFGEAPFNARKPQNERRAERPSVRVPAWQSETEDFSEERPERPERPYNRAGENRRGPGRPARFGRPGSKSRPEVLVEPMEPHQRSVRRKPAATVSTALHKRRPAAKRAAR